MPELRVLRTVRLTVRVRNGSGDVVPGSTATEYTRGAPAVFVGAWFAPNAPRVLGTFQYSSRLGASVAPGQSADIVLAVTPTAPGPQYLGIGLFRSSANGQDTGEVGEVTSLLVSVAPGSWLENHRALFLRGLIGVHFLGLAGALLLLWRWSLRP